MSLSLNPRICSWDARVCISAVFFFLKKHHRFLLLALIVPFMTYGAFMGWEALNPYHVNEQEAALDIAPFYFVFAGAAMAIPSVLGMLLALVVRDYLFKRRQAKTWKRAVAGLLLGTLAYAFFMASIYGIADGCMTLASLWKGASDAEARSFFIERVCLNLIFFTPLNWLASLTCLGLLAFLGRYIPQELNRAQKYLLILTLFSSAILLLCPPWWVHDWVTKEDETYAAYYEAYLGHAFLFGEHKEVTVLDRKLYPGLCTQELILEFVLLFVSSMVLGKLLALESLKWSTLNQFQRLAFAVSISFFAAALFFPPWWELEAKKGYLWGERAPVAYLGYACVLQAPAHRLHGRIEILWPLLALEIWAITMSGALAIVLFKSRTQKSRAL